MERPTVNSKKPKSEIHIKSSESPDTFEAIYKHGKLDQIDITQVPKPVIDFFIRYGNRFPEFDTTEDDFSFSKVSQDNGDISFIARHTKTWINTGDTEEMHYILDTRARDIIGRGEIRLSLSNDSEYFKDKPFIGYIQTESDYSREGLGTRRIELMNALCTQRYGIPLYSDTLNSEAMASLWEKLVNEGLATKFKEGPHDRYYYLA